MAAPTAQDIVPWTSSAEVYEKGFNAFLNGNPDDTEADIRRYFGPNYTQEVDDKKLDLAQFIRHVQHLRSVTKRIDITVQQFLRVNDQIADRHTARVVFHDGTEAESIVFLFGRVQGDGRMASVVEATRQVKGGESSKGLGSAGAE